MIERGIKHIISGKASSDGAGVRLTRTLGASPASRHDPFLLLDEFGSSDANDYIAGFPNHPHRGFETVTYMLDGKMLHEDHMGNKGHMSPGAVQWMTAGRGIIHSEMPQQEEGRMRGFQLWINLPARHKMCDPAYQEFSAEEIPRVTLDGQGWVKVIAGQLSMAGQSALGPVQGIATDPVYMDIALDPGKILQLPLPAAHNALVYVYEGMVELDGREVSSRQAAILGEGEQLTLQAVEGEQARMLLIAARPIGEPVVQYGPFVMNTTDEIRQAIQDFQSGRLTD